MPSQISKSQFKAKALELFRQVEETGNSLIVTDHGRPSLEIRPFRDHTRTPLEVLRGSVQHFERPTDPVADNDWEAAQ